MTIYKGQQTSFEMWQTEKEEAKSKCGTMKPHPFLLNLVLRQRPPSVGRELGQVTTC